MMNPTLNESEQDTLAKYRHYIMAFSQGQFVAIASMNDEDKIIGSASTLRIRINFGHAQYSFRDISPIVWLTDHDPQGDWLYGARLELHPDYRHKGIEGQLYAARWELIRRLNLRGEMTIGIAPGYNNYRDHM